MFAGVLPKILELWKNENKPDNIYLFKVNNRNTEKGVKNVQS